MLDIKWLKENKEAYKKDLKKRNQEFKIEWVDRIILFYDEIINLKKKDDELRHLRNKYTEEIKQRVKQGNKQEIEDIRKKVREINKEIEDLEKKLDDLKEEYNYKMDRLPLMTHSSVPVGKDDSENQVVRSFMEKTKFDFKPRDHIELYEMNDLADIERAAKVAGARFYYLKKDLVKLEFALIQYALDVLSKEGFELMTVPMVVKKKILYGTGFLPEGEDAIYTLKDDNYALIGTAEVALGGYHMNEVFNKKELPKWYAGYSSCFRTEAGSHGRDTKGFFRVHQFEKIEMFKYCLPENSWKEHEHLIAMAEKLFQGLKIPYRIVNVCTGDLGYVAKKYDLEVWLPGQDKYREAVSASNCLDYQARRLNIRYLDDDGKKKFVHTLNSTSLAIQRALIAIMENYQTKDGKIKIPDVLKKYIGDIDEISSK